MSQERKCNKCGQDFEFTNEDCWWQEYSSYSLKLVKCPHCGCVNVIREIEDRSLNLNFDSRYYDYSKKSFIK